MADTLQKVFLLFVRPFYNTVSGSNVYKVFPLEAIQTISGHDLQTNNSTAPNYSTSKINKSGKYKQDPWFLHSSYTSYDEMRLALKELIVEYGTGNIKCTIYVPIDFSVLPIE